MAALAAFHLASLSSTGIAAVEPASDRRSDGHGATRRRPADQGLLRRHEDQCSEARTEVAGDVAVVPIGDTGPERMRLDPHAVSWGIATIEAITLVIAGIAAYGAQAGFLVRPDAATVCAALAIVTLAGRSRRAGPDLLRDLIHQPRVRLAVEAGLRTLACFAVAAGAVFMLGASGAAGDSGLLRWLGLWAAVAAIAGAALRYLAAGVVSHWRRAGLLRRTVAIFGAGDLALRLLERLHATCADAIELVGLFDDRRRVTDPRLRALLRGTSADLIELSRQRMIDRVIVALPHAAEQRLIEVLQRLHQMPVEISLAPDMVGFSVASKDAAEFGGLPLIDVYGRPLSFGQNLAKSAFDKIVATIALVLAAPVLLAIAAAIRLDSKGPVLFRQPRLGFGDRVIGVYKFRTMRHEMADFTCMRQASRDDPRITRVGRFLRRSSLDELPQLFNVLRGEMSLVGPRPHAVAMTVEKRRNEEIVPDYALRHHVKPGITGWAQVNGYYGPVDTVEALRARVAHDLDYINNWSLWFDIRSLLLTVRVLFTKRHAY
jgi:Undecaprenyl-phosphate glucose phosphotransferase